MTATDLPPVAAPREGPTRIRKAIWKDMANTLAIILAVSFLFTGLPKATGQPSAIEHGKHLGFSARNYRALGVLQILGAAALGLGLIWKPIGVAAAIGFTLMMAGAVIVHLRAGDPAARMLPAAAFGLASIAVVVLHLR
ncbi:DoxX family protein [Polymorphospora lycopeni]|uniref:DoxX family protein n=1 Tax=Polymorphospora lycopeni TaxID=3140240 RepID=A0ABV5CJL1_9ACTN